MAFTSATRNAFSSFLIPSLVTLGSTTTIGGVEKTSCEVPHVVPSGLKDTPILSSPQLVSSTSSKISASPILHRRMTAIGRFSLGSETLVNPSVSTFFLALSGDATTTTDTNADTSADTNDRSSRGMSVSEFQSTWTQRKMYEKHPRFAYVVSRHRDGHFEPHNHNNRENHTESNNLNNHNVETDSKHFTESFHPILRRIDLRKRIESLLMEPIDVYNRLWEVQISSGTLGSSGAVPLSTIRSKKGEIMNVEKDGKDVEDTAQQPPPIETLLLFRAHHSMADAVSLVAALGDFVDQADELRQTIYDTIQKRKITKEMLGIWARWMANLRWWVWMVLGGMKSLIQHGILMMKSPINPFLEGELASELVSFAS